MKKTLLLCGALTSNIILCQVGIVTDMPGSTLTVAGSVAAPYKSVTAAYTMTKDDYFVSSNASTNTTISLPAFNDTTPVFNGRIYEIKNASTTSTLTVAAQAGELINSTTATGIATITLLPTESVELIKTNVNSATGVTWELKGHKITQSPIVTEPWYNSATSTGATGVGQTIYHSGKVGVGTNNPLSIFDVNGAIRYTSGTVPIPNTTNSSIIAWNSLQSGFGESEFINYRGTGGGGFRFYTLTSGVPVYGVHNIAFINIAGVYTNSDTRLKTNITDVNNGISKVMAMRPVMYDIHSDRKSLENSKMTFGKDDKMIHSAGFLAQELAKILPEAVDIPKDESKQIYSVNYGAIVPVLTKAIQEQQSEIETLKAEIRKLSDLMSIRNDK
ncbi:tail fiber domain-containing protein [Chryseobacterium populi]|uniref:Peptidase S74 domain-containing protein n=1 Tax=Chryseobacterium populi TaxID=1144316 RepID=J2SXF2_9FLAO|nr:tail fiber domain-containing protein [Chryseobacterium populi]EJL70322.1 hypothetical protein PMI13_02864 [Chryseobacterium populi]